jgi:hypothetical protein
MIIQINSKDQIIAAYTEELITADNETSFKIPHFSGFVKGKIPYYNKENNTVYYRPIKVDEEKKAAILTKISQVKEAKKQKANALKWLAENDWKVNKRSLGEWPEDDPRWLEYLAARKQIRDQFDAAEAILAQN